MFNVEFLHVVREYELKRVQPYLEGRPRLLEIGGGTGYQARRLAEGGCDVASIDVQESIYADRLEFPVRVYDGHTFPFPDASFDVVFSSNVLEHVRDLGQIHTETRRVLRPNGYCVHVLPSAAWRLWTNVAHYVEMVQRLVYQIPRLVPRGIRSRERGRWLAELRSTYGILRSYVIVPRHGEFGNALTEIARFSRRRWLKHFRAAGYEILEVRPIGLFYTGHMVLGGRVPLPTRERLARFLGSACVIYKLRPAGRPTNSG